MEPMTCKEAAEMFDWGGDKGDQYTLLRWLVRCGLATKVGIRPRVGSGHSSAEYTFHPLILSGMGLEYPEDTNGETAHQSNS